MTTPDAAGTPGRRTPHARSAAAIAVVALLIATSCGGAVSARDTTTGTLGSMEATPEELALGAVVVPGAGATATTPDGPDVTAGPVGSTIDPTSAGDDSDAATDGVADDGGLADTADIISADEPIGPPLPPLSTAEQVRDVIDEMHGPTSDVSAQMNRLTDFPDLPTPAGATIVEVRADVREMIGGNRLIVTSEVMLSAPGTVDELTEVYTAAFEELGWERSGQASLRPGRRVEQAGYQIPGTAYEPDDVELTIGTLAGSSTDDPHAEVRVRYVELVDDAGVESPRSRFEGWIGSLPLPAGGTVTGAAIQTSDFGRHSLHYSLAVRYDDIDPLDVAAELRSELPAGDYAISPRPSMGDTLDNWVYLNHPFFADARISPHSIGPIDGPIVTVVNVDARVEFSPRD